MLPESGSQISLRIILFASPARGKVLSVEMEKALMPCPRMRVKAELVLEINADHEIANTLKDLKLRLPEAKMRPVKTAKIR